MGCILTTYAYPWTLSFLLHFRSTCGWWVSATGCTGVPGSLCSSSSSPFPSLLLLCSSVSRWVCDKTIVIWAHSSAYCPHHIFKQFLRYANDNTIFIYQSVDQWRNIRNILVNHRLCLSAKLSTSPLLGYFRSRKRNVLQLFFCWLWFNMRIFKMFKSLMIVQLMLYFF